MAPDSSAPKVAFALGGLEGSKAHGVGFLHAAFSAMAEP